MQRPQLNAIHRYRKWGIVWLIGLLLVIGFAEPVYATDFRGGDTIVIDRDEVIDDDLFVSGGTVTVNGTVKGNLFAAGETVIVNGHIEGSLFIAGRTLEQNGVVEGSTYAGGYAVTLGEGASIARNLNFGGYSLTMEAGSAVGRSLYAGGYQLLLNGRIERDVNVGSGALEVTGDVGGDLVGTVGSSTDSTPTFFMPQFEGAIPPVPPGVRISPEAKIGGTLAVETVEMAGEPVPPPFYSPASSQFRWAVGEFLALLIVGLLLFYIRPTFFRRTEVAVQEQWLPSLGVGLLIVALAAIAVPLFLGLIVLLAIMGGWLTFGQLIGDIVGLGIAALLFAVALLWFVIAMITKIVVAYTGGVFVMRNVSATSLSATSGEVIGLVVGILIYMGLRILPFGVGSVFGILVTLLGLGAIYFAFRRIQQPQPVKSPITVGQVTEARL